MDLRGKKVLVVGLGRSGLSAALFLRRRGAQVTVSDVRPAESLAAEIPALLEQGIMVEAGGHGLLTFRRQDLIVVSPGVPPDTPELVQVRAFGLPVIGELELAARFLRGPIAAITGSNGKTTTTSLVGAIFASAGLPTQVGGNIGVPVVDLVEHDTPATWEVLELSSFQLETAEQFHPRIACILNITPDHLDRHKTMENYISAKERIARNQTRGDALVLNADDDIAQKAAARLLSARGSAPGSAPAPSILWFSRQRIVRQGAFVHGGEICFRAAEQEAVEPVMPVSEIPLRGSHNLENVLAAVTISRIAGIPAEVIRRTVGAFEAVEHRLEFVAELNGVAWYNDSKATNVDSAAKAIAAFPAGVHLILGGKDKNSDYRVLNPLLGEKVTAVYTIGAAAAKIEAQIAAAGVPVFSSQTLENAVAAAARKARPGDVVLLAPACSSFDQFANYEQRGRRFKDLVSQLAQAPAAAGQGAG